MSITPCGDHTQLCSGLPFTFRYVPSPTSVSHSTREKLIRQRSPSRGGTGTPVNSLSPAHGQRISTVQPLSVSRGSFGVPSTCTAVFRPITSQPLTALPPSLYGFVSRRSQVVLRAFSSSSAYR